MTDPTNWRPNGSVWRGWWDIPGWFALIRDFGLRGTFVVMKRTQQAKRLPAARHNGENGAE